MTLSGPDDFSVLTDTFPDDCSLPAFMVSTTRGFLPRADPIAVLPDGFDALESIMDRMPIKTADGSPGLLARAVLSETVRKELPDLCDVIEQYKNDLPLMNALYRDYSFLASAYLLEPCHQQFLKDGTYGIGRESLPRNIALPISKVAELLVVFCSQVVKTDLRPFASPQSRVQTVHGICWVIRAVQLSLGRPFSRNAIRQSAAYPCI